MDQTKVNWNANHLKCPCMGTGYADLGGRDAVEWVPCPHHAEGKPHPDVEPEAAEELYNKLSDEYIASRSASQE